MTSSCSFCAASLWTAKVSFHSRLGDFELLALVVEALESGGRHGIDGAFGDAEGAGVALLHQFLAGHEFGVAAEQNVGTAAGHVGGDGDHAEPAGLGDEFSFALVQFGVEHDVADAFALKDGGEAFGLFNGRGADQDRLLPFRAVLRCCRRQL